MRIQSVKRLLTVVRAGIVRPALAQLVVGAAAFLAVSAAQAVVTLPQQPLNVAAANSNPGSGGNLIYDLTLSPSSSPNGLISGALAINGDGSRHGSFSSLTWVVNPKTLSLDLIVGDTWSRQIVRYKGPNYGFPPSPASGAPDVLFSWSRPMTGPPHPVGLSVDAAGNLFVVSPRSGDDGKPTFWVLPVDKTTGNYGTPRLIDQTFGGVPDNSPTEVTVAGTAATAFGSTTAWNAGDVLVLIRNGDDDVSYQRVVVYTKAQLYDTTGAIKTFPAGGLPGPASTAVTPTQFRGLSPTANPRGVDIWPADATYGVSLLLTTSDGRIVRFDTRQNKFVANFASGLGYNLQKIKVANYGNTNFAFVSQLPAQSTPSRILQFGAPPVSGANIPLKVLTQGVIYPIGLAVTVTVSTPVAPCFTPGGCQPLGPQTNQTITGAVSTIPSASNITLTQCIVPNDPRVVFSGTQSPPTGSWSCIGGTIDVANYCKDFPSTILPPHLCGHSGPSGSAFVVVKASATVVDQNINNAFIQTATDANVTLPGPYNRNCTNWPDVPLVAWAPRSDLPTIEGSIVEWASLNKSFIDVTSACDGGTGTHNTASMLAYGLGLNSAPSGLGSGSGFGFPGFVNTKFSSLTTTITTQAAAQILSSTSIQLQSFINQSQAYFGNNKLSAYSCAINSLASTDNYVRANATPAFFANAAPPGLPNPAGAVDARTANLFMTINNQFEVPNLTWPTNQVPPCVTLVPAQPKIVSGSASQLGFQQDPALATFPPLYPPNKCTPSWTGVGVAAPGAVSSGNLAYGGAGSAATTTPYGLGNLSTSTYNFSVSCTAASPDAAVGMADAAVIVFPPLTAVTVTPASPAVGPQATPQFTATGTFATLPNSSNGPIGAPYPTVVWSTDNATAATIDQTGKATCQAFGGTATIKAQSGAISGTTTLYCPPQLVSIAVTPASPTVGPLATPTFTATGTFADGSVGAIGALYPTVQWTSGTPAHATIGIASGQATCRAFGGATLITATSGTVSGNTTLTCSPKLVSIAVTPVDSTVAPLTTPSFTATGTFADGSVGAIGALYPTVQWTSGTPAHATIGLASGQATCTSIGGLTTITATSGSVSGNTTLTCSPVLTGIAVTPAASTVAPLATPTFTAIGAFADGSHGPIGPLYPQVQWSSDTLSAASIGLTSGQATCTSTGGLATITATSGSVSGNTTLTCSPVLTSIVVTPTNPTVAPLATPTFTAIGGFADGSHGPIGPLYTPVQWSSGSATAASIGLTSGQASCTAIGGPTLITATSGSVSGSTTLTCSPALSSIAVTPASASVADGLTQPFGATGTFADGSVGAIGLLYPPVQWSSDTIAVATIGVSSGVATCVAASGSAMITAQSGSVTSPGAALTCLAPVLQSLAVTPATPSIPAGTTQPFTATGSYSDGSTPDITTSVAWSSNTPAVATIVANTGVATCVAASGSAVITAQSGLVSNTATITCLPAVLQSIAVTPASVSVASGLTQPFIATGTYSDASTPNVTASATWTSDTPAVATIVANTGVATCVAASGSAQITAQIGSVTSNAATLTCTAAVLQSIAVTPGSASIASGSTQPFTATGTYSDASTPDVTTSATWSSDTPAAATIVANTGVATCVAASGSAQITAQIGLVTSTAATLTCTAPP